MNDEEYQQSKVERLHIVRVMYILRKNLIDETIMTPNDVKHRQRGILKLVHLLDREIVTFWKNGPKSYQSLAHWRQFQRHLDIETLTKLLLEKRPHRWIYDRRYELNVSLLASFNRWLQEKTEAERDSMDCCPGP